MNRTILLSAAVLGMLSIVLGAFGAHGLKALISPEAVQTFETGVRYQMYHALLLLFVGNTQLVSEKTKRKVFYSILVGVVFFSGSIYALATNTLSSFDFKTIGFVTPIGGLLFIIGWAILFIDFLKKKH